VCTLILGVQVLGPGTVLLAANRDEDPARPSDPPDVLVDLPRVVGGRDRVAGGTWLAVRRREAAVAMLNRRPGPDEPPADAPLTPGTERRSRGLLAIDVAALPIGDAPPGDRLPFMATALARQHPYASFSLVTVTREASWVLASRGIGLAERTRVAPGWHVLTHTRLDDPDEPRAAWLGRALRGFAPATRAEAEARVTSLLRLHAGEAERGAPAVCIHEGRMQTVSAALVWLAPGEAAYAHADGPPCTTPFTDYTHLLPPGTGA